VWTGLIPNQGVGASRHAARDVGVQVEGGHDRSAAEGTSKIAEYGAGDIGLADRGGRPVQGDEDRVEAPGAGERPAEPRPEHGEGSIL